MQPSAADRDGLHVFLSYRRSDCQAQANGLHDGLIHRIPSASIFMDVDSIPYGVDFEEHIRKAIQKCDIVLVLIGDNWLDKESSGRRRIDEPEDFVRLEIENSLESPEVRVIPVLVEGAVMPRSADLPTSIRKLARLNAIELSDQRWKSDVERLARLIEGFGPQSEPVKPETRPSLRLADVDGAAVAAAIDALPEQFQTKDVSEHATVTAAHGTATAASNYHAMIGTYIARNCEDLGVKSLGKQGNRRGELWGRRAVEPPPRPVRAAPAPSPTPPPVPWGAPSSKTQPASHGRKPDQQGWNTERVAVKTGKRRPGRFMVWLPFLTAGLAAWVPPALASTKAKDPARRKTLRWWAVGLAASGLIGFVMVGSSPEGETSALSSIGTFILLPVIGLGTWLAITNRDAGALVAEPEPAMSSLPGASEALAQRHTRSRYLEIVVRDPDLARDMNIGRPDLDRNYDDAGLLDLNRVPSSVLVQHAGLTPEEAEKAVAARGRLGGLSSVDDLVIFADVNPETAERLKDRAVFL